MFTRHEGRAAPVNVAERFAALEQQRKLRIREPHLPDSWASIAVALSVLMMSYSHLLKLVPILIFLLLWLPLVWLKGASLLRPSRTVMFVLLLPLLAIASTLWSSYASKTLYLGTAFFVATLCIIITARTVRFPALVKGLTFGLFLTLLLTLLNGRYTMDHMTHSYALTGLFESKNQVGFAAELGILSALMLTVIQPNWRRKLLYAAPALMLAATCLYRSHSGTAILSLLVALAVMGTAMAISRLPRTVQLLTLTILPVLAILGAVAFHQFNGQAVVLKSLGKDTTLTGRTYLWEEGTKIAQTRPLLGHGYGAFWVHGQPRAEQLWHKFHIAARTGFHFHNAYIQAAVDLGLVGATLVALLVASSVLGSAIAALRSRGGTEPLFLLGLSVMFLVRSTAEIDFSSAPFGLGVFVFYLIPLRLAGLKHSRAAIPPTSLPSGLKHPSAPARC